MTSFRKIPVARPATGKEESEAVREVLTSGWLTQGPKVEAFEKAFAKRHGAKHAVACSSGTTALHLILAGIGVSPGDEVIVPSFTWVSVANAVLFCGGTPVLVDVDRRTFNINPKEVERKLTPRTKAVIAVHLFGLCADMTALRKVVGSVPLIEDAACAAGSECPEGMAGAMGYAGAFSFHARKVISTGEGGMVTTQDDRLAEKLHVLRNQGAQAAKEPELEMPSFEMLGFNYRLTDIQASIGQVQLSKLDSFIEERSRWAGMYREGLENVKWLETPFVPAGYKHAWQAYVCFVKPDIASRPRKEIMKELARVGIQTRAGTHAIHTLGFYRKKFGDQDSDLPFSKDLDRQTLALPMHNRLSSDDIAFVIDAIQNL